MARKRHDSLLLTQELISFASPIGDFNFEGNRLEEETNLVSKFVQDNFETKDMVSKSILC